MVIFLMAEATADICSHSNWRSDISLVGRLDLRNKQQQEHNKMEISRVTSHGDDCWHDSTLN